MVDDKKTLNLSTCGEIRSSYFGIDLHKDQLTWHCINRMVDGSLIRLTGKILTRRIINDFIPMLSKENCFVIVEASCSTFFYYSLIESFCTKAIVINPAAFREMYMTGKKTDRIDAKKLADRLIYHIEMNDTNDGFPEVFVPDTETLKIRKLVTAYELLVKQVTQIKNQMKSIFRAKLIEAPIDILDTGLEETLKDSRIDNADKVIARSLKTIYDNLLHEKMALKKEIIDIGACRFRSEIEILTTISGISVMSATVFMADVVTVDRFSSSKKMTSYLASVGKVDASGNNVRNGGLNKRGRRTSYRFILQGLEHIVNGNEGFMKFKERHVSKRSNKVRAAIVRKTFVTMFYMLKNKEVYRYLNQPIYERKMREFRKTIKVIENVA